MQDKVTQFGNETYQVQLVDAGSGARLKLNISRNDGQPLAVSDKPVLLELATGIHANLHKRHTGTGLDMKEVRRNLDRITDSTTITSVALSVDGATEEHSRQAMSVEHALLGCKGRGGHAMLQKLRPQQAAGITVS